MNCFGDELDDVIKKLFKSFVRLIEYFKGKEKIKGLDFNYWGYEGVIRSLEVIYKKVKRGRGFRYEYYLYLYVLIVFKGDLGEWLYENFYLKDYLGKRVVRKFNKEEIII